MARSDIRLALPSKGTLQKDSLTFLEQCGMQVKRLNPRQYVAKVPNMPGVTIIFQRPGDIAVGVREGSLDLGITGLDILSEIAFEHLGSTVLILHDALGFGPCSLNLAVPEKLPINTMADLAAWAAEREGNGRFLRIATKFPKLTAQFLEKHNVKPTRLINAEGTLEIAPSIGYADLIADLVSTGVTLRDNHLRQIEDGEILSSQACLIANQDTLKTRPEVLEVARQMLEYIEAHLRAEGSYLVTANVRGETPDGISRLMLDKPNISGLQGPTISLVASPYPERSDEKWFAINIVVRKENLVAAIAELRSIGGSGVIVAPCTYIFEEEPARYKAMLAAIKDPDNDETTE
ncbi:MAG: ATP phosphoribosyltransferase [Chloroflexi bacterium]|nr:ATP phosphoribosyltransferase [Chloroflexota bacterium]